MPSQISQDAIVALVNSLGMTQLIDQKILEQLQSYLDESDVNMSEDSRLLIRAAIESATIRG